MKITIPVGMVEVSQDEFWRRVMSETRNIHPFPERHQTNWRVVNTRTRWGWVSEGYGSPYSGTAPVYAVIPEAAA